MSEARLAGAVRTQEECLAQKALMGTASFDGEPIPRKRGDRSCLFRFTKESQDGLHGEKIGSVD